MTDQYESIPSQFTLEHAQKKAEKNGCVIELGNDHMLQLDLDNEAAYKTFLSQVRLAWEIGVIPIGTRAVARPSKSGNIHVMLVMPENVGWSATRRILVQALLGSDLKRELLNFRRFELGNPDATLLFRPKDSTPEMPAYFQPEEFKQLTDEFSDPFSDFTP